MKNRIQNLLIALAILATFNLQLLTANAQGTAFSYQGRLNDGTNAANGKYDLAFSLFNSSSGGIQTGSALTNTATALTNGLFTVTLNFGTGIFTGTNLWLDIRVRTNGSSGFTELTPRQQILPVPYAIFANTASNLSGAVSAAQISGTVATATAAVNFTGSLNGNVTGTQSSTIVANVGGQTAANVASGASAANAATSANTASTIVKRDASGNFSAGTITASLSGNASTATSATTATTATTATNANNFSGSLSGDVTGTQGATVVAKIGGQTAATVANAVSLLHMVGTENFFAGGYAGNSTMSGSNNVGIGLFALTQNTTGRENTAIGDDVLFDNTSGSYDVAIGYDALPWNTTGSDNTAIGVSALLSNTSGNANMAIGNNAMVANTTGNYNTAIGLGAASENMTGNFNTAIGCDALYFGQTGTNNIALGFQAGNNLSPLNPNNNIDIGNAGVFGDNNITRIGTSQTATYLSGNAYATQFYYTSDRNLKENFTAVIPLNVLAKVVALPVSHWNYKGDAATQHMGPMAQDFRAAFGLGTDDKHIGTVDEEGVALVAIQGLNQKMESENTALRAENAELKARLQKLEQLINVKNVGGQ